MKKKILELDRTEINKVIDLFHVVWGGDKKLITTKTNWAFKDSTKSKVLVLKNEEYEIISVRGALKWPLYYGDKSINTFQFHGTCVHPNYRRRGLFSLLNKEFVNDAASEGYELIFNVSVKASRLGYEKLGWKYIKGFRRLTLFNKPRNLIKSKIAKENIELRHKEQPIVKPEAISISGDFLIQREKQFKNLIHTKYTNEFINWRLSNKNENYQCSETENAIVIYKVKFSGNVKELIIGEVFLLENRYSYFNKAMKKLIKSVKPDLTYTYIFNTHPFYNHYLKTFFLPNPLNYNLHFGTRTLGEENKNMLENKKWGVSFLDIDTF
jgi:hypothetical protein